jgi:hypothetical protein
VQQEGEAGEDEDEDEARGSASSGTSSVYLRGPSTLPSQPHTTLLPVIRLEGQR